MQHIELLYQLKQQKIQLWAKPDGNLGFSFDQEIGFADALKKQVSAAKAALHSILQANQVDSEAKASALEFYRVPEQFQQAQLSDIQQGIYLQASLDSLPYSYNVPVFIDVPQMSAEHAERAAAALRTVLARHAILRLKIGANMACEYFAPEDFDVAVVDINADQVTQECQCRYQQAFQLQGGKLIQSEILRVNDAQGGKQRLILNLTHHHILSDAFSIGIVIAEVMQAAKMEQNEEAVASTLALSYRDFQAYQQALLNSSPYQDAISRLSEKLGNAEILLQASKRRGPAQNQAGIFHTAIDSTRYQALRQIALEQGVSLYALLLTGLYHCLSVYNGAQHNFAIGLTISNRPFSMGNAIGPFISTLPLLPNYQAQASLASNLRQINDELSYLNEHQHINLNQLAARLPQRAAEMAQLMHVMFTLHNFSGVAKLGGEGEHSLLNVAEEVEKFGLSFTATELADGIELRISYASDLYSAAYIAALADSYLSLLGKINASSLPLAINQLSLCSEHSLAAQMAQVIEPVTLSVDVAFEAQVLRTPHARALSCGSQTYSFHELNQRANQLARHLRTQYALALETPVAVWLDDSADVVIAMLAVIKAGGCYVPLSNSFPQAKVDYILGHIKPALAITHRASQANFSSVPCVLLDDAATLATLANYPSDNLALGLSPQNLAYIMYTSGTTNNPKGVMIEHAGITSLACDPGYIAIQPEDAMLLLCDLGFDVATFEIWSPLLNGARIVIPEDKLALLSDTRAFTATLKDDNISLIWLTKTLFDQIYVADETIFANLRCLLVGGEALNKPLIDRLVASPYKPRHLINGYGPTENTTFSCTLEIDAANLAVTDSVLIGKPMRDRSGFVLDASGNLLPDYAVGELCVGGAGVARGYLHNPELNRKQFIANPFQTPAQQAAGVHHTLYRTGDLVRRHASGDFEYLGRIDKQVKLRGYRIELPEIEEVLLRAPGVAQVAVIVHKFANADHLLAYYVATSPLQEADLKAHVAKTLPTYMLPSRCIAVDSLPTNQNGKLDKARLPIPSLATEQEYCAPRNALERNLCAIFGSLFEIDAAKIGCHDDFFGLGGNSVLAISVASKINQALKVSLTARSIYEHKTIASLAEFLAAGVPEFAYEGFLIQPQDGVAERYAPFPLTNVQQAYQLGRSSSFGLGNVATHIYQEHAFSALDVGKLEASLNALIQRHPALRTVFSDSNQQILEHTPYYQIAVRDMASASELEQYRAAMSHKIYDSSVFPMFDIAVSNTLDGIILHLSFDALLMDAHSFRIFFDEWTLLYGDIHAPLPELELSYRDYVCRYDEVRNGPQFAKARSYWENRLDDYNFDLRLPMVANPQQIAKPSFQRATRTIPHAVWQRVEQKAQRAGVSPTVALLVLYGEVLCFWSGQSNVCINLTLFNRLPLHPQVNDIVGDFTVLELFNYVRAGQQERALAPLISRVHQALWDDIDHNLFDGIDFQRLARSRKAIPADHALAPVVFTSLVGNTSQFQKTGAFINADYQRETYSITQTSQVWLDNKAYENREGLVVEWDYVEQLFDAEMVGQMHAAYCRLIEVLADSDWGNTALPALQASDADLQLIAAANRASQAKSEANMFDAFLAQTDLAATAVYEASTDRRYSYGQLQQESQQLARYLVRQQSGTDAQLVAILCEKGYGQVVSALAIQQAGQAYLPLHVEWPAGRLLNILQQGQVRTVLLSAKQAACAEIQAVLAGEFDLVVIEDVLAEIAQDVSLSQETLPTVAADDLAYVIFTSGSTGVPKGVSISHRGAMNTIVAVNQRFAVGAQDRVLALSELSFDLSVYDIFGLLAVGGCIVFPDQARTKEPEHWLDLIASQKVTLWNTVPQLAELLAASGEMEPSLLANLRVAMLSGDWLPIGLADRLRACTPEIRVMSLGGATEGSIWSIWHEIATPVPAHWTSIPYGVAMPNQQMYVLNAEQTHCPVGVMGEIHIGGMGVALNYWGDAERTAASYFDHPTLGRLYRTGDLGRWHADGYIEFAGRKDKQLKLRGYRVELGEIEHALANLPGVKQAVVVALEDAALGSKYLAAYYVAPAALEHDQLLASLRHSLPEYMIPSALVHLTALPLSANGKLDSARLPAIGAQRTHQHVAPRDELEHSVCALWAKALNLPLEKIGIRDEFFNLGGDSIISIQLSSKMRQQLGVSITIQDIFNCKTVEALCAHVRAQSGQAARHIASEQGVLSGSFPLLPVQSWFFSNQFAVAQHWNQSFLVRTPALERARLHAALTQVLAQHDALRLQFSDGMQHYAGSVELAPLTEIDVSSLSASELQDQLTALQADFDLANGPLYRFAYLHGYSDGSARVFFALHHLIVDTVSWSILAEDLQAAYEANEGDQASASLPAKLTSYRQWVANAAQFAQEQAQEANFWQALSELAPAENGNLALSNMANMANKAFPTRSSTEIALDKASTQRLLQHCNHAYHTQINDLLLAALADALQELTGKSSHHVLLEGHGREEIAGNDISRTVGWFATLYPICLTAGEAVRDTLINVKEHLRAIPHKGLNYGQLLGNQPTELPAIRFNYLGQINDAAQTSDWQVEIDDAGVTSAAANVLDNLLDIGGLVKDGCLRFGLNSVLTQTQLTRFAAAFERQLQALIQHCANKQVAEYTPSDFALVKSEADLKNVPLLPHTGLQDDWFEMTEIQKVYLLGRLGNYEIGNVSNHVYHEYYYDTLDVARLEAVVNRAITAYPVLRTVFSYDRLQQRFLPVEHTPHYTIARHDFKQSQINPADVDSVRSRLSHKVYNAECFPLFSYEVSEFANGVVLHISTDLILLDAHSRQALFEEIDKAYRQPEYVFQAPSITFYDYQTYYQLLRKSAWYELDKQYWLNKLPEMPLRPELPFLIAPEAIEFPKFTEHTLFVEAPVWSKFKEQARKYDVSYSSVLLGLYGAVLSYFSGHKEFLITMTLFNRYEIHEEVNALWGDFTSTNLFHFRDFGHRLIDTLRTTHREMWADISHSLFTGMDVQRDLAKRRQLNASKAVSPIVFTGLVGSLFDELESQQYLHDSERVPERFWSGQTSQSWIDLQAIEVNGMFMSKWLYVDQLFSQEYVGEMNKMYNALIHHLAQADWEGEVGLFQLPAKDQALVAQANAAVQAVSEDTLFSAFMAQTDLAATAVYEASTDRSYSYGQLQQESQQLARYLVRQQSEAQLVAILCEKGYGQVVSALAIQQAGQAYLPLHVEWPAGRLLNILQQGQVRTVLLSAKQAACAEIQAALAGEFDLVVIEDVLAEIAQDVSLSQETLPVVAADDLAYVIFTSGSTGVPKGVSISHRGAMNTILAINQRFAVGAQDRVLALSELSFDLSVYDIFGLLAVGGCIVFPDQARTKEPEHWLDLIASQKVTLWNTVPQLAELLAASGEMEPSLLATLRVAMLSGDWLPIGLADRLRACTPEIRVMSLGGATEGSIWSIWHEIATPVPAHWTSIPYGVAMPNQQMYVLNAEQTHCPVGVIGEIHIGGMGVALNYWGDAERTAASYFDHPTLGRLYRTGDLGRWHADGYIEFAGRKDKQLKLRGYRVELGEIEHALANLPGVKQAVVVALEDAALGSKYLAAYYVAPAALEHDQLLASLRHSLPEYMIPSALVHLTALPLSANGKLDSARLPAIGAQRTHQHVAPRDELEHSVCALWAKALNLPLEKIGIRDEFFNLGGDSIISIQLSSKMRQQLGVSITIQDIFNCKTVEALCAHVRAQSGQAARQIASEQGVLSGSFPLLPVQSWFFSNQFAVAQHWNQSFLVRTPALERTRLHAALTQVLAQHDALRLQFSNGMQHYVGSVELAELTNIDVSSLSASDLQDQLTALQADFDLSNGPLYRFAYLHGYSDGSARVFFALHHLIVDTVSWSILAEDLQAAYEGNEALPAKLTSYRQWVATVADYEVTHRDELPYWLNLLQDASPIAPAIGIAVEDNASDYELVLSKELTASLLQNSNAAYHTQTNDLLLTAFAYALADIAGRPLNHVLLEGHGRETIADSNDVSRTLGWFTTLFPVALSVGGDVRDSIKANKENLRSVPNKGIGFGPLMGYQDARLPKISFNYLGRMAADTEDNMPALWQLCAEAAGVAISPRNALNNDIGVIALVQGDALHLRMYSHFGAALTERLALALQTHLHNIVAHCTQSATVEYTASDFAEVAQESDLANLPLLHNQHLGDWFEMTAVQRAYLMGRLANYEIGNISNHIYNEYCYQRLDVPKLQRAFNTLIEEYDVLRTVYSFERLQQRYLPQAECEPYQITLHDRRGQQRDEATLDLVRDRLSHKVYDATRFPLFSFEVTRFDDCDVLHISIDLILLDAQSRQAMFMELDRLYRDDAYRSQPPSISFKDYQEYFRHMENSRWYQIDRQYWLNKVDSMPLRLELPFLMAPEAISTPKFTDHTLYVGGEDWQKFKEQSRKYGVSYSSVLLGLYGSVLAHFSGYREFLITMTVFNRYAIHEEVAKLWGDFTSTNLFHFSSFGKDVLQTLKRTHDVMWQDIDHGLFNGIEVQRELARRHKLDGNKAVSPIVFTGIIGNLLDETDRSFWLDDSEIMAQRDWSAQTSQAWIDLQAIEADGRFMSKWLYVEQLFAPSYVAEMNQLYCALITHLAHADWESAVDLFQLPQRDQALIAHANQAQQGTSEATLCSALALQQKDVPAVFEASSGKTYGYAQLQRDSDLLARYLRRLHAMDEVSEKAQLVAVLSEKGYGQIVSTLAVMQAGQAYLPLHVEWPTGRLDTILQQGNVRQVLLSRKQAACAEIQAHLAGKYQLLVIEDLLDEIVHDQTLSQQSLPPVAADDLAYVIFTSGSTGLPKGVSISHRGAMNTIAAVNQRFAVGARDRVLALSELSFDLSVYDIFGVLAAGGCIVCPEQSKTKDPAHWLQLIASHGVTLWNTVPQLAELLVDAAEAVSSSKPDALASLRVAMLSGDWLPVGLADRLHACTPQIRVMSLGGATEGSIWSIWYEIGTPVPAHWNTIPYGVAMPNQQMYVLSSTQEHCPVGVLGEIHIGGAGVALNYWGDAERTAASFFEHPTLGRLYRTGDLGRWHSDGYIEFAGRKDKQLKLRGYRVELGEIEHALASVSGVKQAVVVVHSEADSGSKSLLAYYVAASAMDEAELREKLRLQLPEYMLPASFTHIHALPLSANGKLDASRLPMPQRQQHHQRTQASNALEEQLCAIWAEVLGVARNKISVHDNFFDLGGNSILMIKMKGRIEKAVQHASLEITDLFKYSNISELAAFLQEEPAVAASASAQQRLPSGVGMAGMAGMAEEIAVVAVNGSFPQAQDVAQFWDNILHGKECFERLDLEECEFHGVPAKFRQHKDYVPIGGKVAEVDKFDPAFWNLSVNDAKIIDPQIRKFLECAWQALELAGHINDRRQLAIGVYAGMSESSYSQSRIHANPALADSLMTFGTAHLNEKDYLATRVSYLLGLTGPALNLNTACSTSLVAIAEACKNLAFGECDVALAGGVSLPMPDNHGYIYQEGGIFAKDGHCRSFDAAASGTVGGAGVGVVVLKRLSDALRDGNQVLALVKGYAVNNDGDRKAGYMAPSIVGQTQCILSAQRRAGVRADSISYVECHGTGTALGDPIEIAALHDAFSSNSGADGYQCHLGAVKANIGHAGSAAGVAGFIKLCAMLQHKRIPGQINFTEANPALNLARTSFQIPQQSGEWQHPADQPRRAAVSSFGFGGTNAHVILEEFVPTALPDQNAEPAGYLSFPIAAKSAQAVERYCTALADYLEAQPATRLPDVAYTLQHKREHFAYRKLFAAHDRAGLIAALRATPTNGNAVRKTARGAASNKQELVFMFSGQGSQYVNMARQLYAHEPLFASVVNQCAQIVSAVSKCDFLSILFPAATSEAADQAQLLKQTRLAQPALFVIGYALARLLNSYGIHASCMVGHSIGEYVAATLAGVFTLEDALFVVCKRGQFMQEMPTGSMLAVQCDEQQVLPLLPPEVVVALYNAPRNVVLSGPQAALQALQHSLQQQSVPAVELHTSHAFHSTMMAGAAQQLESLLANIKLSAPQQRFVSNLTGELITAEQATSPAYWAAHLLQPVQFNRGVQTVLAICEQPVFLELGPGQVLCSLVQQQDAVNQNSIIAIATLPSAKGQINAPVDDAQTFHQALGALWSVGYALDWPQIWQRGYGNAPYAAQQVAVPPYQFEQISCWLDLPQISPQISSQQHTSVGRGDTSVAAPAPVSHGHDIEAQVTAAYLEILGNESLTAEDDFFALGGNSLSALRLTAKLNHAFNLQISLAVLHQHASIKRLAGHISQQLGMLRSKYQPIVELNQAHSKERLFMFHPGIGGCEVYTDLARSLMNDFHCYGVDSFNLNNADKIDDLAVLAGYYLARIDEVMASTPDATIRLLGWSLGGMIALEVAAQLEQRGHNNIQVYLLDTIIDDQYLTDLKSEPGYVSRLEEDYLMFMELQEYPPALIQSSLPNIALAVKFEATKLSCALAHTQVVLFKAMQVDAELADGSLKQLFEHATHIKTSNVDTLLLQPATQLRVLNIAHCHHNDILDDIHLIKEMFLDAVGKGRAFAIECGVK